MREIKFRAWDKNRKKMFYSAPEVDPKNCGNLIYCDMENLCIGLDGTLYLVDECGNYGYPASEEYEVNQFTGLHDKNGKEIYEGDIAKMKYSNTEDIISDIKFIDGGFYLFNYYNGDRFALGFNITQIEVIGNIYENPELLKMESK